MLIDTCSFLRSDNYIANMSFSWPGKLLLWGNDKHDPENPSKSLEKHEAGFFPPNYETTRQFIKAAFVYTLGLSGVGMCFDLHQVC